MHTASSCSVCVTVCVCVFLSDKPLWPPKATQSHLSDHQRLLRRGVRQHHGYSLLKKRRPAGYETRLPGEPQQSHQDEENTGHHLRVAGTHTHARRKPQTQQQLHEWQPVTSGCVSNVRYTQVTATNLRSLNPPRRLYNWMHFQTNLDFYHTKIRVFKFSSFLNIYNGNIELDIFAFAYKSNTMTLMYWRK